METVNELNTTTEVVDGFPGVDNKRLVCGALITTAATTGHRSVEVTCQIVTTLALVTVYCL